MHLALICSNFQGVQNIMDGHFMKKKKEGDQITKYGDHSRKENEVMQTKVEENQYNTMYHSFKWGILMPKPGVVRKRNLH